MSNGRQELWQWLTRHRAGPHMPRFEEAGIGSVAQCMERVMEERDLEPWVPQMKPRRDLWNDIVRQRMSSPAGRVSLAAEASERQPLTKRARTAAAAIASVQINSEAGHGTRPASSDQVATTTSGRGKQKVIEGALPQQLRDLIKLADEVLRDWQAANLDGAIDQISCSQQRLQTVCAGAVHGLQELLARSTDTIGMLYACSAILRAAASLVLVKGPSWIREEIVGVQRTAATCCERTLPAVMSTPEQADSTAYQVVAVSNIIWSLGKLRQVNMQHPGLEMQCLQFLCENGCGRVVHLCRFTATPCILAMTLQGIADIICTNNCDPEALIPMAAPGAIGWPELIRAMDMACSATCDDALLHFTPRELWSVCLSFARLQNCKLGMHMGQTCPRLGAQLDNRLAALAACCSSEDREFLARIDQCKGQLKQV